jgi:hypothetical protein
LVVKVEGPDRDGVLAKGDNEPTRVPGYGEWLINGADMAWNGADAITGRARPTN